MILITTSIKRMRKPRPTLPVVECTEADARSYFAGFWAGIFIGSVIGAGLFMMAAWSAGIL